MSDPGAVTRGYAALLQRRGGVFVNGGARSLRQDGGGWVDTADGPLRAREAVVALGPWSTDVLRPLGYRVPMAVKRGYHQHFALERGAALTAGGRYRQWFRDDAHDAGTAPDDGRRVRLARRAADAGADRPGPRAGGTAGAAGRGGGSAALDGLPACMPDMRPVIGPAPNHAGLWLSFGHAHHGFTLGPVTGRLLASLITGEAPDMDPAPRCAVEARRGVWRVRPCRRALRGAGAPPWPACPAPARSATSPGRRR